METDQQLGQSRFCSFFQSARYRCNHHSTIIFYFSAGDPSVETPPVGPTGSSFLPLPSCALPLFLSLTLKVSELRESIHPLGIDEPQFPLVDSLQVERSRYVAFKSYMLP